MEWNISKRASYWENKRHPQPALLLESADLVDLIRRPCPRGQQFIKKLKPWSSPKVELRNSTNEAILVERRTSAKCTDPFQLLYKVETINIHWRSEQESSVLGDVNLSMLKYMRPAFAQVPQKEVVSAKAQGHLVDSLEVLGYIRKMLKANMN